MLGFDKSWHCIAIQKWWLRLYLHPEAQPEKWSQGPSSFSPRKKVSMLRLLLDPETKALLMLTYSPLCCVLSPKGSQWSLLSYQDLGHHHTKTCYIQRPMDPSSKENSSEGLPLASSSSSQSSKCFSTASSYAVILTGLVHVPFMVGLNGLKGIFQPKLFYYSMISTANILNHSCLSLSSLDTHFSSFFKSELFRSVIKGINYIHVCILIKHFFCD